MTTMRRPVGQSGGSLLGRLRTAVIGVVLLGLVASVAVDAPGAIATEGSGVGVVGLETNAAVEPLGIDDAKPQLSWRMAADRRAVMHSAYQVLVASAPERLQPGEADVWDSGKVTSANPWADFGGRSLMSQTRYHWTVRVWDNSNVSDWGNPTWFETAFLNPSDWTASWIGKDTGTDTTPEPLLRREFELGNEVASARVYVSGIGYHKLFLNGERIGDHQLDPGMTDFDRTVLYVTHDVTEELRQGANAIGVSLGRGWYAGGGPITACAKWCSQPKLRLELHVSHTDGTSSRVVSDSAWQVTDGPTTRDSVSSEDYDARLEQPGWTRPGFDDTAWSDALVVDGPAGELRAQSNEPIKVTGELQPAAVTEPGPGIKVYDFGVVTAGWARLVFDGEAGTKVTIRYSEKQRADGTAVSQGGQEDIYILTGGGPETYEPSYGYKGFQYVQVSADPIPEIRSVEGLEVHSSVPSTGGFDSSSDLLNRYHEAMRRTILNNLHSVPTDTPVHEKLAYGGDAHLYGESAIRNFGMAAFFDKWMLDFTDAQRPSGMIPVVVPDGEGREEDDPVWGAAVVLIHNYLHMNYGDVRILRRGYPTMKKWMDYYGAQLESSGYIYDGDTYGDWTGCVVSCSVPPIEQGPPNVAPGGGSAFPHLIGTAFLYKTSRQLAEIARAIGEEADAQDLDALADNIAGAFHDRFYNPVTQTYGDVAVPYVQTSNLLALSFGLTPSDAREPVVANLAKDVSSRDDHLNTGATGTKLILPVLTDEGHAELAYRVATNPTHPGWGHWFLECGATTMWESWTDCSSDVRRGGNPLLGSTAPRSLNHAFFGTVDDWLFTHVAGIQPAAPGFREIQIKPFPVGDLTWASAFQTTPMGRVSARWTRSAHDSIELDVTIPPNSTGLVHFPGSDPGRIAETGQGWAAPAASAEGVELIGVKGDRVVYRVGSGTYRFRTVDPGKLPDLTVTDVSASQDKPKQTVLTATVANRGSAGADGVQVEFRDGETVLGRTAPISVAKGESATVNLPWDTRGVKGERLITAVVDPANVIAESDEANNTGTRTVAIRGNKVENGSFESSSDGTRPDGWSSGGSNTSYDTSGAHASDGNAAVGVTGGGLLTSGPTWTSGPIDVTPGRAYDLAMTVATTGAESSTPSLSVGYLDAIGTVVGTTTAIAATLTGDTPAQQVTGRIVIPAGVSKVRLTLSGFAAGDGAPKGTVWFEDIWMW